MALPLKVTYSTPEEVERVVGLLEGNAKVEFSEKRTVSVRFDENSETIILPQPGNLMDNVSVAFYRTYVDRIAGYYHLGSNLREHYAVDARRADAGNENAKVHLVAKKCIFDKLTQRHMTLLYPGAYETLKEVNSYYPPEDHATLCNSTMEAVKVMIQRGCWDPEAYTKSPAAGEHPDLKGLLTKVAALEDEICDAMTFKDAREAVEKLYNIILEDPQANEECQKNWKEAASMGSGKTDAGDPDTMSKGAGSSGCDPSNKNWNESDFQTNTNPTPEEVTRSARAIQEMMGTVYRRFHGESKTAITSPRASGPVLLTHQLVKFSLGLTTKIFARKSYEIDKNCTVFICVDLSGSMGNGPGSPKDLVTRMMRYLGHTLETAGVRVGLYGFGSNFVVFKEPGEMPTCGPKFWALNANQLPDLGGTCGYESLYSLVPRIAKETTDKQYLIMATDGEWYDPKQTYSEAAKSWLKEQQEEGSLEVLPMGIGTTKQYADHYGRNLKTHLQLSEATKILTAVVGQDDALVQAVCNVLEAEEDAIHGT